MVFGKKKRESNSLEENLAQWREIREGKIRVDEQEEGQDEDNQCFVVTAVYGTPLACEVDTERQEHDRRRRTYFHRGWTRKCTAGAGKEGEERCSHQERRCRPVIRT